MSDLDTVERGSPRGELASLRAEVAELKARVPQVTVREPMTYRRHGQTEGGRPYGYFHDRASASSNPAARRRLDRHALEMAEWTVRRDARAFRALDEHRTAEGHLVEYRVNPSTVAGEGGYETPPAWLLEDAAIAPRPKRVLAKLVSSFDLPAGVSSINVPVMTAGNLAGPQAENAPPPSQDVTDAATSCGIATISSIADVATQLRELSPTAGSDHAWFTDMTSAYDYALEQQLYFGNGATGINAQFTGLLNIAGKSFTAYTDASPSGHAMFTNFGPMAAHIGNNRGMPPYAWLMRTARWAWLTLGSEDTSDRPMEFPELFGADNPLCPGALGGWPCWMADALPQTLTWSNTTVTSSSNNVNVATFVGSGTLNVTATAGFASVGSVNVQTSTGWATITYTGSTSTTLTGCTTAAGSGTLSTNNALYQLSQGTTANEDVVIACVPPDIYLFEGTPTLIVTDEPLSGALQSRFVLRNYAAAVTGRYATGISVLGGTGLIVQSGYTN